MNPQVLGSLSPFRMYSYFLRINFKNKLTNLDMSNIVVVEETVD